MFTFYTFISSPATDLHDLLGFILLISELIITEVAYCIAPKSHDEWMIRALRSKTSYACEPVFQSPVQFLHPSE